MKKILSIAGDGIGKEVMPWALALLSKISKKYDVNFEVTSVDWGADKWLKEGVGLPKGSLEAIPKNFDAILFGALGDKRIPDMAHGKEILLGLRFGLDLFINLRPTKLLNHSYCPLKNFENKSIDFVIFRENTQDIYRDIGGSISKNTEQEIAIDESIHTFFGVQRIVEAAFAYANNHKRQKVTLIDKSNAIRNSGALWGRVFNDISQKNPHILTEHLFVDTACLKMLQNPENFDVIVTTNLFGDILSDLACGLIGGLGLAASANIKPGIIGLFEPVHGSAPDIAGKNLANPFGMFLSVAMMLEFFNYQEISKKVGESISVSLQEKFVTKDLGGTYSCDQVAEKIIERI